jgi:YVTN family beta-propeller protein
VTPDGGRAFVANIGSGTISALDLENGKLLGNIATGEGAEGIAVTPDGKEVWVTNRAADTITVIDTSSLKKVSEMKSASFPIRATVTPDGKHVLISNAKTGDVAVFDVAGKKEVRRISMKLTAAETEGRLFGDTFGSSSVPIGILIRPGGKTAYVANANADLVTVLDLVSWKAVGGLETGKEPDGLGYSPLTVSGDARASSN